MLIAYHSITGNVRRFVGKLGAARVLEITDGRENVVKPFVLVTPTTGFGQVPIPVAEFAARNSEWLRGVAVSGNVNWGANYGKAGAILAERFAVPLLLRFELSGTGADVRKFNEGVTLI